MNAKTEVLFKILSRNIDVSLITGTIQMQYRWKCYERYKWMAIAICHLQRNVSIILYPYHAEKAISYSSYALMSQFNCQLFSWLGSRIFTTP